ncbi:hypothetical protein [Noviherbaspirillum sedimenti]|uniref:DUF3037 domain-containing protein n=1 Tax=Noviherbaspirillum sedimenti TaxID=2320865 RepID=A0A3A3GBA6_9BURK|nr:hypothetical protein [Noviherbaspirillum sedimenti]RJG03942.1 hypothetical protein D3878_22045 [Noviherbaspirillum sedimenti]
MIEIAQYSLVTICPIPERMDRVVMGVIARSSKGWDVSFSSDYTKVLALDPNFAFSTLNRIACTLKEVTQNCKNISELRNFMQSMRGIVQIDQFEGRFAFDDEPSYNDQLNRIMTESVNAPPKIIAVHQKRERSQLRANLKKQFASLGVLGQTFEDIHNHKVVARYPIQADQGLFAEFALKNSVMHVTETIDFTLSISAYTAKKYEAQAKCLVLKAATEICGANTKKHVVVAGGKTKNTESALRLLMANAELYQFEDSSDMTRYIDTISKAAHGYPTLN